MKNKILLLILSTVLIWSCNSKKEKNDDPVATPDTVIKDDHHIIKNTVDINGSYRGTVPCDDCEGIETEIQLNSDYTYIIKTKYIGRDTKKIPEEKGIYSVDTNKMIITLEGANQYIFRDNALTQLDIDGNPIPKEMASKYVLRKEQP